MSTLDLAMLTEFPYNVAAGGVALGALGASFYLARKYLAGGVCHSKARLDGKVAIITGANTGIGKETAVDFAQRNARVIMACRNVEKGREALDEVVKRSGSNKVVLKKLDLSSLASVRKFAEEILKEEPRLDILVNNAGVMMCPYSKTEDGFEMQIGVNHFGHFLLTNLLLDRLKEAPKARIVNVSSVGHYFTWGIKFYDINSEKSYSKIVAYAQSKLANILFTKALAKRLEGTNVTVNALHPGPVATDLERHTGLLVSAFVISQSNR